MSWSRRLKYLKKNEWLPSAKTRWQRRRDEIEESETRPTEIYPPRFRSMTHVDGFWPDENSWTLLRWNALFKANARHWPPIGRNMENPLTGRSDCLVRMNPEKNQVLDGLGSFNISDQLATKLQRSSWHEARPCYLLNE